MGGTTENSSNESVITLTNISSENRKENFQFLTLLTLNSLSDIRKFTIVNILGYISFQHLNDNWHV